MLVLSRKKNESIKIDENITITVVEVKGDRVRLGIEAPKHIRIMRSEVPLDESPTQPEVKTVELRATA